jgi:LuxR family maltose regulon positive regulatory protein
MGFIQLGNHMRTLAAAALKDPDCAIPKDWLENIQKKSATYAKRAGQVRTQYILAEGIDEITLTQKELELLRDLSHGLSRNEIADERGISVNTVKMTLQYIFEKLGAENSIDAVRIAFYKNLL